MTNLKLFTGILLTGFLLISFNFSAMAGKEKVQLSTSETDAEIYIDGKLMGKGTAEVVILSNSCVTVHIEKIGFLRETISFCNKKNAAKPPKSYYVTMKRDDAYDASIQTDIANIDIELKTTMSEEDAWKLISMIITSYFDVIEVTDRETGYLRTSWVVQSFQQNTIRTRMIVKLGNTDPLTYKIKLVSEESRNPGTSVKSDELYREWDRVLRKYSNVIDELTSRLK
ncbi:MAG: hypothetical protein K9G61_11070 [Bacteroidales bacterium]|jgi:hypothetical protein|nr:hypothetical protein [Bacteroidota bacterium]MCF8349343.1 hypothetical protein [Bacteroidales bacterium]